MAGLHRRRWLLIALLWPAYVAAMVALSAWLCRVLMSTSRAELAEAFHLPTMLEGAAEFLTWDEAVPWAIITAVATALQGLFLLPLWRGRPRIASEGRSLAVSVLIAALVAAVLSLALFCALVGLAEAIGHPGEAPIHQWWAFYGVLGGSWVFWSFILLIFAKPRPAESALSRLVVWLFTGTAVEVLAVIPIDILVRRRISCYCFTGSYFALCLSTFAVLWLAGPGIVLVLFSRRRRMWSERHCAQCGYAMGPRPGDRCPECGHDWQ